jgi:two-component system response regulator
MDKRVILIVEDNPDDQLLLRNALEKAEVQNPLKFVANSEAAKEYLQQCEHSIRGMPSLIFLDLWLPNETGLAFLEELRNNKATHRIPVIVLTQSHQSEDLQESYQLGANSFIYKDGSLSEFNSKIRCICDYWLRVCQLPVA